MNIPWQSIDTVLLDMDGTLLDLHFDNYFWQHYVPWCYSQQNTLTLAQAQAQLTPRFAAAKGSLSWYCLDYWSRELSLDIVQLKAQVKEKIALRPHVRPFLQQLRAQKKRVILLTNAHRASLELKMQQTRISDCFDDLISTHDYGFPKENPLLWQALQKTLAYQAPRCLLVDDGEHILDCALASGVGHVLTLKQPDSQMPLRQDLRHPAILHFDEIMP